MFGMVLYQNTPKMKRKIIRMILICMLIGFSISPTVLKSQTIQNTTPFALLAYSNTNCSLNFINWLNLISFISDGANLIKTEYVEADSFKLKTDFSKNNNSDQDISSPKLIQTSDKKIKRKSYRNMPVTIETRI